VSRQYALSNLNNALPLTISGGTGFNWDNPYTVFIDTRFNKIFTLDLTPVNFNGTSTSILFDTRPGTVVQNTGKTITIIFTGFSPEKRSVATRYSANFGSPGSVAGEAPAGALDQINTFAPGVNNPNNGGSGSVISLVSNGTKFVYLGSSGFD
jgi:hypothetical protein